MNPEEIQEAAKEAGLYNNELDLPEVMQNFAAIIEKRTIERCAAYLTSGSYMALNPFTTYTAEQHVRALKAHDKYQAAAILKLGGQ